MTNEQLEKGNSIAEKIETLRKDIRNLNYPEGPTIYIELRWLTKESGGGTVLISGDTAKKMLDQAMELKRNDLKEATSDFERI